MDMHTLYLIVPLALREGKVLYNSARTATDVIA